MPEFTPGPWRVCDLGKEQGLWVSAGQDGNGFTGEGVPYMAICASAIGEANARLIAAAPDMLEALEMLLSDPNAPENIEFALRMVAKAKGGAE